MILSLIVPVFKNQKGKKFEIKLQRFNDINRLTFISNSDIVGEDLLGEMELIKGDIIASVAYVHKRSIGTNFYIIKN